VFYVVYCLVEVPSNLILKRVGAKIWLDFTLITWSVFLGLKLDFQAAINRIPVWRLDIWYRVHPHQRPIHCSTRYAGFVTKILCSSAFHECAFPGLTEAVLSLVVPTIYLPFIREKVRIALAEVLKQLRIESPTLTQNCQRD
jgi:hypothetical protein